MAEAPRSQQTGGWQSAIDWQSFFTATNYPVIGYDPINDKVIIKESSDYSADNSQDVLIYDMKTGAWTKSVAAMTNTVDTTNFVINGDSELVLKQGAASTNVHFKKWSSTPVATTTLNWTSKAFDFGHPSLKKKLYKVIIHSKSGSNVGVKVGYDNAATSNIFTSNTLSSSSSMTKNELTVSTPIAFSYLTLELSNTSGTVAEQTKVVCIADSSDSLNAKYFDIYGATGKTEVWIDTDNSGTAAPSGSGSYAATIEVTEIETNDTAESVAIAVAAAIDDHADFSCSVNGDTIIITDAGTASRTDASDGDTNFTITKERDGGSGSIPAGFEVNDIALVYRTLRPH